MEKETYGVIRPLLGGLLLICSVLAHANVPEPIKLGPVPDWVAPISWSVPAYGKPPNQAMNWLLVDEQLNLTGPGKWRYVHHAMQPVAEQGLEQVSEIAIHFSPDYESLTLHRLDIIRDGKRSSRLATADIKIVQREQELEKRLFNGVHSAIVLLNDVRIGDVIEYDYSIDGVNPVFGDKRFAYFSLGWSIPVGHASVRVVSNPDKALFYQLHNLEQSPKVSTSGSYKVHQWQRKDIQAIRDEGEYPNWYSPYAWLELTEYRNWQEVVDWAQALYQPTQPLSEALLAKVEQWKKSSGDKEAYVQQALRMVQDEVRYFGVEMGQNSHRPSHPNLVYERRYGDCKDKALLLTKLLHANGIDAVPALVNTKQQHKLDEVLPSPGMFDHVITRVQFDSKVYWLDGTVNYQHGKLDSLGFPDFKRALVLEEKTHKLISMKPPADYQTGIFQTQHWRIADYHEPAVMQVESEYVGAEAEVIRRALASRGIEELSKYYLNFYARYYPGIKQIAELVVRDDKQSNRLKITEQYAVKDFVKKDEGQWVIATRGDSIYPYLRLPNTIDRSMPLAYYSPLRLTQKVKVSLPNSTQWAISEQPVELNDDVIEYRRSLSAQERSFIANHELLIKRDHIEATEMPEHFALRNAVENALFYAVSVPDETAPLTRHERLSNLLHKLMLQQAGE